VQLSAKQDFTYNRYSPENCDFTGGQYDYDLYFEDDRQMEAYMGVTISTKSGKEIQSVKKQSKMFLTDLAPASNTAEN